MTNLVRFTKEKLPSLFRVALETLKSQQDAVAMITASDALLQEIAVDLRYNGARWLFVEDDNEYYDFLLDDIRDILPDLSARPLICFSSSKRWLLVAQENYVEPIIFLYKANKISLYRVVLGKNIRWLPVYSEEIARLRLENADMRSPQFQNHETGLRLGKGDQLRDPKWDIGGCQL